MTKNKISKIKDYLKKDLGSYNIDCELSYHRLKDQAFNNSCGQISYKIDIYLDIREILTSGECSEEDCFNLETLLEIYKAL